MLSEHRRRRMHQLLGEAAPPEEEDAFKQSMQETPPEVPPAVDRLVKKAMSAAKKAQASGDVQDHRTAWHAFVDAGSKARQLGLADLANELFQQSQPHKDVYMRHGSYGFAKGPGFKPTSEPWSYKGYR